MQPNQLLEKIDKLFPSAERAEGEFVPMSVDPTEIKEEVAELLGDYFTDTYKSGAEIKALTNVIFSLKIRNGLNLAKLSEIIGAEISTVRSTVNAILLAHTEHESADQLVGPLNLEWGPQALVRIALKNEFGVPFDDTIPETTTRDELVAYVERKLENS
jgi:hypothetical protein